MSCKIEIVDKKDLIVQLEASKSSIKDLLIDLLNETRGFKYQITVKVLLKKYKPNGEIEFTPVYFNSSTKTEISQKYKLNKSFQEILYRIDAWIDRGSGWIIESIDSQYINISTYRPLVGSYYIDLPIGLKHPRKGLINIKNNNQKCFLWCHVRHVNPVNDVLEELQELIKKLLIILIMMVLNFLSKKKILKKLKYKTIFY